MKQTTHLCVITHPASELQVIYKDKSLIGLLKQLSEEYGQKFKNEDDFLFFVGERNTGLDSEDIELAHFHDIVF